MPLLTSKERLGTVVCGRYRIESVLGRGGMGVVFAAERLSDRSPIALKLPRVELCTDETRAERLALEGSLAALVRHPHVVSVLDQGLTDDGVPFVAFERLIGSTLAEHVRVTGPLPAYQALAYLLPIAGSLAIAHDRGVVHRDLKPQNVFLHQPGGGRATVPKLLDFGLAKTPGALSLTVPGTAIGTPDYMAPEQIAGERTPTAAMDIWSLTAVLHFCLHAAPPDRGERRRSVELLEVPTLHAALARGLRTEPCDRYPSMRAWVEALVCAALADGVGLPVDPDPLGLPQWQAWLIQNDSATSTVSRATTGSARDGRRARRRPRNQLGALLLALLALGGLALASAAVRPSTADLEHAVSAAPDPSPLEGTLASDVNPGAMNLVLPRRNRPAAGPPAEVKPPTAATAPTRQNLARPLRTAAAMGTTTNPARLQVTNRPGRRLPNEPPTAARSPKKRHHRAPKHRVSDARPPVQSVVPSQGDERLRREFGTLPRVKTEW